MKKIAVIASTYISACIAQKAVFDNIVPTTQLHIICTCDG